MFIKMSIIKAVIYFSMCHLIVCQRKNMCDIESSFNRCSMTIPSSDSELRVSCFADALGLGVVNRDSTKHPFSGHNNTNFPSLNTLWNRCRNNTRGLDDPIDSNRNRTVDMYNVNMIAYPDNYFCNFPSATKITLYSNSLSDTRKLGFSPLENCGRQCLTKLVLLSLSYNHFERVPNDGFCGLEGLRDLSMDHCRIIELESGAFVHLKSLKYLSLHFNNISILSPGVFRQQQNTLKTLILSHNKLNNSSIMELKNLRQLDLLNIAENHIDVIPNGLFDEMSQLTYLSLENNHIKTLKGALTGLTNLEVLIIFNNDITVIRNDDFKNLSKLFRLEMENNPIETIEPQALTDSANLHYIIKLSNASLSTVPNFISKLETFQNLYLANNKIAHIRVGTFDKPKYIRTIDLSYNQLTDITNVFTNCSVGLLILENNRITKINLNDFSSQLSILKLEHNHIRTVVFDVTGRKPWNLKYVDMSYNQLTELNNISLPEYLGIFAVTDNNISSVSFSDTYVTLLRTKWAKTTFHFQRNAFKVIDQRLFTFPERIYSVYYHFGGNPLECSCENNWLLKSSYVDYVYGLTCQPQFQRLGQQPVPLRDHRHFVYDSNTSCRCDAKQNSEADPVDSCNVTCPTQCKCYNNVDKSIIHIDCSSNNIKFPLTPTVEFQELYVYLDNNSISQIHSNSFDGLNGTIELYLNWTGLCEIADGSFDHLIILNVLNVEHNNLRHISEKMFKNLNSLTQLFLSHNKIKTIEPNAFPTQLQTLRLDNNQLVGFTVSQLDNLTKLRKLSVHANQWSCECNHVEKFQKWLKNHSRTVEEIDQIFCVQSIDTEQRVPLMTFNASHCHDTTVTNAHESHFKKVFNLLLKYFFN